MSPSTAATTAQVFDNGVIKQSKLVLEVASGSRQHICHFSEAYPEVTFQLTEYDNSLFSSIHAYTANLPVNNRVKTPLELNATKAEHWHAVSNVTIGSAGSNQVITTNVFHIAPGLLPSGVVRGSGQTLKPGGRFILLYGAFEKNGKFSTESHAQILRGRDPLWESATSRRFKSRRD
ncbi:hypothetical protein BGX30_002292 [Mortierella sp. GBA39]|nr:hypothetical protein BGX30_002292 [Mortierella sp. GBA39]